MSLSVRACAQISDIAEVDWNACANPPGHPRDPFLSWSFLSALEASGSAVAGTGWAPYHLVLEEDESRVRGVVPLYLKSHSRGEYVFDYAWADAFERAGGRYYPKLQCSIPFTPATGRRLLTADPACEEYLAGGVIQVAEKLGVSSVHVTFTSKDQWDRLGNLGFLQRTDKQFHWHNQGYEDFEAFLSQLSAKKRKNIRRERRQATAPCIRIERLTGNDIREEHWDAFYRFYRDTGSRKWGSPYLTREFFSLVGASMPEDVLLVMCKRNGRYIAGAINFIGSECLFGRNWGCVEHHPFLHFEVCYYQAIEFAIERGLKRVEAGAQGPHKLARGYLPTHTYSAHWIVNPSFREAVEHYLEQENRYVQEEIDYIETHSPFRKA